jgi:hypothetical protein
LFGRLNNYQSHILHIEIKDNMFVLCLLLDNRYYHVQRSKEIFSNKSININILPLDKGVMVDYHTKKKIIILDDKFFLHVIIYHNTLIQGQYMFYYTECVMIFMFILFVVTTLFVWFFGCFCYFILVIKKSYHNTCNKHQDK